MTHAVPQGSRDAVAFCSDLVARNDEDFTLSLRYAASGDRARLAALFALQVELRRIPLLVREPPPGEIRLQWWREALAEIAAGGNLRAHPVIELLKATDALAGPAFRIAEQLIDARSRPLYESRFSDFADLASFLRNAEAPVALLAVGDSSSAAAVSAIGEAYALARFAPALAPPLAEAAAEESTALWRKHAPALAGQPGEILGRIAFLSLGRGYAKRPDGRQWPVGKRLAMFRAVLSGRL